MRYCMNFYLNWHRNCERSEFELSNLLNKKHMFNFDLSQFLCQLRQKFIQYLILKLQSMPKWNSEDQNMVARGGPKLRSFGRRPKLFCLRLRHRPPKLSLETFGLSFYPKSWLLLHIIFDLKDNFDLENLFLNFF